LSLRSIASVLSVLLLLPVPLRAQEPAAEDALPGPPFEEGDIIDFASVEKLESYVPPEFWKNREYFFYEGMQMEIGPFYRDYSEAPVYREATEMHAKSASIGRDGSLEGYVAGRPFPEIDCKGDPQAGLKIVWNFARRWSGDGGATSFFYSYWDRGERLPLYYEGHARGIQLAHRSEPQYQETGGDIFKKEKRLSASGVEVEAPFDARGIMLMSYRYKSSEGPLDKAKNDDTWVYIPDLRRVRRISTAQRTDAVAGTDFTRDDLFSFEGIVPQYDWECLGEQDVVAPFNTKQLAYPYEKDHNFGPYGLSFADDRWEMRHAWIIRFDPKNDDHPYSHKDIWIDRETYEPLYSFAYDRRKDLWKIIWHNHRWSEDWHENDPRAKGGDWYKGWESVPEPRDLRVVCDMILNVQTGTGNRIEIYDLHGTPLKSKGKIRRFIDVGRLNKGR
jgi:hypothetical protein